MGVKRDNTNTRVKLSSSLFAGLTSILTSHFTSFLTFVIAMKHYNFAKIAAFVKTAKYFNEFLITYPLLSVYDENPLL